MATSNRDSLGRRSRFRRTPTGKRLVPTDRDTKILRWLFRYRYLRVTQLIDFVQPRSEKRFVERLGDLYHETGLIDRPKAQWRQFEARHTSMIYEITDRGIAFLEARDALPDRATTISRRRRGTREQFDHILMIVDALVGVELAVRTKPDCRYVPIDEILSRAPETTREAPNPLSVPVTITPCSRFPEIRKPWATHVIPDGLYGIEYLVEGEKRYRFWALECENTSPTRRSSPRSSSLARKRMAYEALIRSQAFKSHWGIPNLKVKLATRQTDELQDLQVL